MSPVMPGILLSTLCSYYFPSISICMSKRMTHLLISAPLKKETLMWFIDDHIQENFCGMFLSQGLIPDCGSVPKHDELLAFYRMYRQEGIIFN